MVEATDRIELMGRASDFTELERRNQESTGALYHQGFGAILILYNNKYWFYEGEIHLHYTGQAPGGALMDGTTQTNVIHDERMLQPTDDTT